MSTVIQRTATLALVLTVLTAVTPGRSAAQPGPLQAAPTEGYRLVDTWTSRGVERQFPSYVNASGLDVTDDDTIYVADAGARTVYQLDAGGHETDAWDVPEDRGRPIDVAVSDDRLYVISDSAGQVRTRDGQVLGGWDAVGMRGVAFGSDRRLYIARRAAGPSGTTTEIDIRDVDGNLLETWQADLPIFNPFGLDVAPDGTVYVAADGSVYSFRDGGVTGLLRVRPEIETAELRDVAVDGSRVFGIMSNGRLVVWDTGTNPPQRADTSVSGTGWLAIGPGPGLVLSTNSSGLRYLTDRSDLSSEVERWIDADETLGQLDAPRRLATTDRGALLIADAGTHVQRWSADGTPQAQWPVESASDLVGGADQPCTLGGGAIRCLDADGMVAWQTAPPDGWLSAANGDDQQIAAVDLASGILWRYGRDGAELGSWPLTEDGRFAAVSDVALDGGQVLLAERSTPAVDVRAADGTRVGLVELTGDPVRLAAADGALFALDTRGYIWKHRITDQALLAVWEPAPDGAPSDIAAGPGGRLYVADSDNDRVLVFEPGGAPGTVPPTPDVRCSIELDKRASPGSVLVGQEVLVELEIGGTCPVGDGRVDVVIVVDQSASMIGRPLSATQSAAMAFLGELNPEAAQVSIIGFSTTARVLQPLTGDLRAAVRAIAALEAQGQTNFGPALDAALGEVTGDAARPDVPHIVVLMTDGRPSDGTDIDPAIERIKSAATLYTIGLGADINDDLLGRMASQPDFYFQAPNETELADVYTSIARQITASRILRTSTVRDELPPDMALVAGSVFPPAEQRGRVLTWTLDDVPVTGRTLSYQVRPQQPGLRPTNVEATIDYVDLSGEPGDGVFPVPEVEVRGREQWTAFLPLVYRSRCKPRRADVVLVFDRSSSMTDPAAPGDPRTKLDAALDAGRTFLSAMQLPGDRASIVTFDRDAETVQQLTMSRAALEVALAGIRPGRGTRIDRGLERAFVELLSPRHVPPNAPVIIVLTDGRPAGGSERATVEIARDARAAGFTVYAIGLGDDINLGMLGDIAGDFSRVFLAPTAAELADIYSAIAGEVLCF